MAIGHQKQLLMHSRDRSECDRLQYLLDVSDIFYFFSARGGERESPRRREGGGGVDFIEISKGALSRRGRGQGPGKVSAANWGIGGGGLNIFFRGRNVHQE